MPPFWAGAGCPTTGARGPSSRSRTASPSNVQDVTLRDGMHSIRHQYHLESVRDIARALDRAKVDAIEICHGDGITGATFNYGFGAHDDGEWISAVAQECKTAVVTVLLLPGIGTVHDLKDAYQAGARSVRIAKHCTEADVSRQHIEAARALGMDTVGFLMMAHMAPVEKLVEQAKLMESYGAECVYVTDSAGALLPAQYAERVKAFRAALKPETEVGVHTHHNLTMGVANAVAGIDAGAVRVDVEKRKDRIKMIVWDGTGMVLVTKWLEEGGLCHEHVRGSADGAAASRLSKSSGACAGRADRASQPLQQALLSPRRLDAQNGALPGLAKGQPGATRLRVFPLWPGRTNSFRNWSASVGRQSSATASRSIDGRKTTGRTTRPWAR